MAKEHYLEFDTSLERRKVVLSNIKLKAEILNGSLAGVMAAIGRGADAHRSDYWYYWYATEHTAKSEQYGYIIEFLRQNGAKTSGEDVPSEPKFEEIRIADCFG